MTESEQHAFDQGHFEEVLGSLGRRLSDPDEVTRTVSDLLAVPDDPNLNQHHTVLRLSRDLDNRISVVTTNFDTLLERAILDRSSEVTPRSVSFAGQALPAPGTPPFFGIIHIHGRLVDADLGLESSPLVLTSADYGDAYMRSGWAARFLFDLARCKTIVLLGYSANDAPVRYFLNVLEADRTRFPDLKPVYVFSGYKESPEEASTSWGTLAVTILPYCKLNPEMGAEDHTALWRDLSALADIADRPKRLREERTSAILQRPAEEADDGARRELRWLLGGHEGLWAGARSVITDIRWFEIFEEDSLWSREQAIWLIGTWVVRRLKDRATIECACDWQRRFGHRFTEAIKKQLVLHIDGLDEVWTRAWRLFCLLGADCTSDPLFVKKKLGSGSVLDSDLVEAVDLIVPKLTLERIGFGVIADIVEETVSHVRDVLRATMEVRDRHRALELIDALCAVPNHSRRILNIATAQLRSVLELENDIERIVDDYDHTDLVVSSIEPHDQNKHRGGVNLLILLLARTLSPAANLDREGTRRTAMEWKSFPGRLGLRLCLHAMRDAEIFTADEAMETLSSISVTDFWRIRREVALLLKDRSGSASSTAVTHVEERILRTASDYYLQYRIERGQTDWREHARDSEVWLRLNMLEETGVLTTAGSDELSAINRRRSYLRHSVEDRDFFRSYTYPARFVAGDSKPIMEAPDDDRLLVAHRLIQSPEPENRLAWSAYCQANPEGALDSIAAGALSAANAVLWNDFLGALAHGDDSSAAIRHELTIRAFDHLLSANADALLPMAPGLANLLVSDSRPQIPDVDTWLEKLWEVLSNQQDEPLSFTPGIYERAMNSTAGKVTQALLNEIDVRRQNGSSATSVELTLLRKIAAFDGIAGQFSRTIMVCHMAFILAVDRQSVTDILASRISASSEEGKALRAVMLSYRSVTPELTRLLHQSVLKGVVEGTATDDETAATIAANLLRPALASVQRDVEVNWGIGRSDVAVTLRETTHSIRSAAVSVLAEWLEREEGRHEDLWRSTYSSFFSQVWPKEREYRHLSLTEGFISIAVAAGSEFPAAFQQLEPYIIPFDQGPGGLYSIESSQVPERFPPDTLSLLWLVCGPKSSGRFVGMAGIIDRLIEADPQVEVDRRLQWLENRAERYD